MVVAWCNA